MGLVLFILLNSLALMITAWLLKPGFHIADFKTAILAAIIIGLINTFIKPFLNFITAPLNFMTLGLFTFVVNAFVLYITAWLLGPSFAIDNFWWAILAAAVLSVVSTALSSMAKDLAVTGRRHKK